MQLQLPVGHSPSSNLGGTMAQSDSHAHAASATLAGVTGSLEAGEGARAGDLISIGTDTAV